MLELAENFLLEGFVRAWEEVAALRQAHAEGRLDAYLGDARMTDGRAADPGAPAGGAEDAESAGTDSAGKELGGKELGGKELGGKEMARRLSARLALLLEAQARNARDFGSDEQRRQHRIALYATTALIDEIFLMELDWPGREAWLDVLLEYRFFRTRVAGQRFFELAEQRLLGEGGGPAQADLAAIFLLALKLGFKGAHRGALGEEKLRALRARLLKRARQGQAAPDGGHLFPQAYQFQVPGKDARLAPLRPWLRAGALALAAYVLLSSAIWFAEVQPFLGRHWSS